MIETAAVPTAPFRAPLALDEKLIDWLRSIARALAFIGGLTGLAVLIGGWICGFDSLRSIIPGAASMKVNTALGLMLTASAVLLTQGRPMVRRFASVCSALVLLISLTTLAEDAFGWNAGIDELLIRDRTAPVLVTAPGRMAVTTAICFVLLGCAVLAAQRERRLPWSQFLSFGAAFICLANLIGYIYGVDNFTGIAFYTGMAVHTSASLLILSLSVLFSQPDRGPMALVSSQNPGGVLVRKLLPAAVVIPIVLGWLRWKGELSGLYGTAFGLAMLVAAIIGVFATLIWAGGLRLSAMDSEKAQVEGLFRLAVESAPNAKVIVNQQGEIVLVNTQTEKYFGYRREELVGRPIEMLVPASVREDHRRLRTAYTAAPQARPMGAGRNLYALCRDGSQLPVEIGLNPIHSPTGDWILVSIVDITARKQAEELRARLAEARIEQRFRSSFEEAPVGMALIRGQGVWLRVNRALCEMTGYSEAELIALNHNITHPDDMPETQRNIQAMRAGQLDSVTLQKRYIHKQGHTIDVLLNVAVIERDETGRPVLFVAHMLNQTDQKRVERELEASRAQVVSSARLSALGMMAGGIAHEINNPLAIIDASAANLLHMAESGDVEMPALLKNCGRIKETAERIERIVRSLRRIAREGGTDELWMVSVRQIVDETLELCAERFRVNNIRLTTPSIDRDLVVRSREAQICQVLLNLLQNAFDAVMDGKGERRVQLAVTVQDPWVIFSVTDSGPGIPPDVRPHIMEPFFTTKPPGKGTGLGLSISSSIASEHGGRLELAEDSVETCFRLFLPLPREEKEK